MRRISESVTLHHVERIVVRDSHLEFAVEGEEPYLWDGETDAEWEIQGGIVENAGEEAVAVRPVDDTFVCEVAANRAVDNVGPVRCRSVESD